MPRTSTRTLFPLALLFGLAGAASASDYNGDGIDDLAVGVPGEGVSGAAQVWYGLPVTGLRFGAKLELEPQDVPGFPGSVLAGRFGAAVAGGDFDGDGIDDLAVGAPQQGNGAVAVFYGRSSGGLVPTDSTVLTANAYGILSGFVFSFPTSFGNALAAGDFNGDGYDDLAVGAPSTNVGGDVDAGTLVIVYGGSAGLTPASPAQVLHQDSPGIDSACETGDRFGQVLCAGRVDGDGYDDLVVGMPNEDVGSISNAGAVHVVFGGAGGFGTRDRFVSQDTGGVAGGAELDDFFGFAVAIGRTDGDFYGDVIVGVPGEDLGSTADAGLVHVLFGEPAGIGTVGSLYFTQDSASVLDVAEPYDRFGAAVAAADFDGDGYADVAIGAPGEDLGFLNTLQDAGQVHVLRGAPSGPNAIGDQVWHQDVSGVGGVAESFDHFGSCLAVGRFNGISGGRGLAIGVPDEDVGFFDAGAVNVLNGGSNGLSTAWNVSLTQNSSGVPDQAGFQDSMGGVLGN